MAKIFISYSSSDVDFAKKLVRWLEEKGHHIWMDKDKILGGGDYREEIAEGIESADIFLPLFSPKSVESRWVQKEIYYADEKHKLIVPILLKFVKLPKQLQIILSGIQYIDFSLRENEYDPWRELEKVLLAFDENRVAIDETKDKKSQYNSLIKYISVRSNRNKMRWAAILGAFLILLIIGSVKTDVFNVKQNLLKPKNIQLQGVSNQIQNSLHLIYNTAIDSTSPSLAFATIVQKNGVSAPDFQILRNGDKISSDDNYFFIFQTTEKAFIYIFQIDSRGKLDWIFPKNITLSHSEGNNPVEPGKWHKIPGGDKGYFLDENLGIEHFYIVTTKSRWHELEKLITEASQSYVANNPILAQFSLKTRGSAGKRKLPLNSTLKNKSNSNDAIQLIEGNKGVVVLEQWFEHIQRDE